MFSFQFLRGSPHKHNVQKISRFQKLFGRKAQQLSAIFKKSTPGVLIPLRRVFKLKSLEVQQIKVSQIKFTVFPFFLSKPQNNIQWAHVFVYVFLNVVGNFRSGEVAQTMIIQTLNGNQRNKFTKCNYVLAMFLVTLICQV